MPPGWSKNDAAACSCCCGAACNAGAHIDGPAAPARAHGQQPHAQHSTTAEASNKAQLESGLPCAVLRRHPGTITLDGKKNHSYVRR